MNAKKCGHCGALYERRRWPCGKLEGLPQFERSRYCCQLCLVRATSVFREWKREAHGGWKGEEATDEAKRMRARRWFSAGACQECGGKPAERHHQDGNPGNNTPKNIALLCRRCHMKADGRLERLGHHERRPKQRPPCVNCGNPVVGHRAARGRCGTCYDYLHRTGRDRTPELCIAHGKERRARRAETETATV